MRARDGSGARWVERVGKDGWSGAVADLMPGGERTTLRAANLSRWETRRGTGARQDSTDRIPRGVAEKQFVVHL